MNEKTTQSFLKKTHKRCVTEIVINWSSYVTLNKIRLIVNWQVAKSLENKTPISSYMIINLLWIVNIVRPVESKIILWVTIQNKIM